MGWAYTIKDLRWQLSADFCLEIDRLSLPAGQTIALLGRSASGKSTLLSLLGRVEGSYFRPGGATGLLRCILRGVEMDLLEMNERALIRARVRGLGIGFMFQREGLFDGLSAIENIAWPLRTHGMDDPNDRARQALSRVGLGPDRVVATLSGGERKRLALGRALALEPAILLLDEPLTGLDPAALESLQALLAEEVADLDRTVVIVTHQQQDVERLADHLVFMDGGRVVGAGSRESLQAQLRDFFQGKGVETLFDEVREGL